jgi:hypothetical protein
MHRLGIRCAEVAGVISVFRPIDAAPQAIGMSARVATFGAASGWSC